MPLERTYSTHDFPHDLPVIVMRDHHQDTMGFHEHRWLELVLIVAGRGIHVTDVGEYPIVAGDVFVISPNRAHRYRATKGLVLTNILFHPRRLPVPTLDIKSLSGYHVLFTLEPQYREKHEFGICLHLEARQLAQVRAWVCTLDDELRSQQPGCRYMAAAVFMQIVGYLSRCYSSDHTPAARPLMRIGDSISYLEENYAQPVALEELARVAHMSKSSLLRAFKQALGVAPIDYLIRLRVSRAAELLRDDELTVTEIAFRAGFGDSNYFARQFRSVMGVSPSEYRRRGARL